MTALKPHYANQSEENLQNRLNMIVNIKQQSTCVREESILEWRDGTQRFPRLNG